MVPKAVAQLLRIGLVVMLSTCIGVMHVRGYAEEALFFRDPYTAQMADEEISTIHDDLTYVLALAAGSSDDSANVLRIWNQLVDSEHLGPGSVISYTNCLGAFYPQIEADGVCPPGNDYRQVAWPLWEQMQDSAQCTTSRYGPYSPFFHFPRAVDIQALHDWAWGITTTLQGYEAYAWGGATVMQATCRVTRTCAISTGIEAGSLMAYATYLHSLADAYSHRECIAAMQALGLPWATHTNRMANDIPACNYNPAAPNNRDAHGREFGSASPADSARTDEAIERVYRALVERSLAREGRYYPLDWDAPLTAMPGTPTLSAALYAFVHDWEFNQPASRRSYCDRLVDAVLSQRLERHDVSVPIALR